MKIICACCGKEFRQRKPLINLCNKCAKKAIKELQEIYNDHSKYCSFKYTCSRSIFFGKNDSSEN